MSKMSRKICMKHTEGMCLSECPGGKRSQQVFEKGPISDVELLKTGQKDEIMPSD